jgi:D-arginine dehydrogenase
MEVDVAIIGGGIAGLSCAAYVGSELSAVVLEAERTLGYHATGRSAALYTECYGSAVIRRLAQASHPFLSEPEHCVLSHRGVLFVTPPDDTTGLSDLVDEFSALVADLEVLSAEGVEELCPVVPSHKVRGGVYEPRAADIDVDGLQTRFVGMARRSGVEIFLDSTVVAIRRSAHRWHIRTTASEYSATTVVNAAGAWGDRVAAMAGIAPINLEPLARSVFTFDPGQDPREWPMVVDAHEQWYIKPEGVHMIGSAASEIPTEPGDVRAEEIDVALGIEKITAASTLTIRSVKNTWAGLRTFAPDRLPVVGRAVDDPQFVWLVGQGGYGIKTSPALGELSASIVRNDPVPERIRIGGIDPEDLGPARFG